ncbi:S-layer homology domain-containing protein [Sinanaerobacter sp. ZZT-01]|uniref:S-layer homology domain-containing protein n=1 Tax=Sinanaerobacter sp. ZZT-01 TaxID=3111540 RepID=UPI002D79E8BD|nr:S-layer homology domain-containing protein [Sinanaerobacter sp. ZZT-01]WRR94818.1 S-layer homology domain-containing protein [Sinanaerobacter sp. ZZT-01]
MKKKLRFTKVCSIVLVLCFIFSVMSVSASSEAFNDIQTHWAKGAIERFSENGTVSGYAGAFKPSDPIKRGDMAVILNKIVEFNEKAENTFTDLKESSYYAEAILKLKSAGVMSGAGNFARPEDQITREEAALMLCQALNLEKETVCNTTFKDEDQISSWAKEAVYALVNKGWMSGFEGKINAKNKITRAEVVTILDKAIPKNSSNDSQKTESSATAPTIETTLVDGKTVKPSKLTFDVYARSKDGKKIDSKVTLNGEAASVNWDDQTKTSFTLKLKEGENIVVVSAASDDQTTKQTYTLYHKTVKEGESVGHAVFTVEMLTLGSGYLVTPTEVEIFEGENAAKALLRILDENGLQYEHTGTADSSFYLSHMKGIEGKAPMDLSNIPSCLKKVLEKDKAEMEPRADADSLGEFDYTSMSGWMYSVNNVFPNVGFADTYLQDGDVVRVQFTVWGYGRDIGGADAMGTYGSNFYTVADKTELLRKVAEKGYVNVSEKVKTILTKLDASQTEVDHAL